MDKKQTQARRRQEDRALNRALLWVGAAVVLEFLLLLVNRYYINFRVSDVDLAIALSGALKFIRAGGFAAGAACLVWAVFQFRKGGTGAVPLVLSAACGALAVCAHVSLAFQDAGMKMLFLLVPAWAGLALIYYLYQREFFLAACAVGMSILGLWFVRYGGARREALLTLAGIAVVCAAVLWLKKTGGAVSRPDGTQVHLLSKTASYPLVLVSCLASLAAVAAAMVLGGTAAYYLIFVMVAWLFALLVYYTVKLM